MHPQIDFLNRTLDHVDTRWFIEQNVMRETEVGVYIAPTIESRRIRRMFDNYIMAEDEKVIVVPIGPNATLTNTIILLDDGTNLSLIVNSLKHVITDGVLYAIFSQGTIGNPGRARLIVFPNKNNARFGVDTLPINGLINFYIDGNNVFHQVSNRPNRSLTVSVSKEYGYMYLCDDGDDVIYTETDYFISPYLLMENCDCTFHNPQKIHFVCKHNPFVMIFRKPVIFHNRISSFLRRMITEGVYSTTVEGNERWREHKDLNWKKKSEVEFTDNQAFDHAVKSADMAFLDQHKQESSDTRVFHFDQYTSPIVLKTPTETLLEPYVKFVIPSKIDKLGMDSDSIHKYKVEIEPKDLKLCIGEKVKYYMTFDGNRLESDAVNIRIDNNSLGQFLDDGYFHAKRNGVGKITMSYHGIVATTEVNISAKATQLHPMFNEIEFYKDGIILRLDVDGVSVPNNLVTWSVSDSNVARVDFNNYTLVGMRPGEITLNAYYKDKLFSKQFRFLPASITHGPVKSNILIGERVRCQMVVDGLDMTRFCNISIDDTTVVQLQNPVGDRQVLEGMKTGTTSIKMSYRGVTYVSSITVGADMFIGDTNMATVDYIIPQDDMLIAPQPSEPEPINLLTFDIPDDIPLANKAIIDDRLRINFAVYADGKLFTRKRDSDLKSYYEKGNLVVLVKESRLIDVATVSIVPKFSDYREWFCKITEYRNSTCYLPSEFPTFKEVRIHINGVFMEPNLDYQIFEYSGNFYLFSKRITSRNDIVTMTFNLESEEDTYTVDEVVIQDDSGVKYIMLPEHNYDCKELYMNGVLLIPNKDFIELDYRKCIILKKNTKVSHQKDGRVFVINHHKFEGADNSTVDNNTILQLCENTAVRESLKKIQRDQTVDLAGMKTKFYSDIGYKKHLFFTLFLENIKDFHCSPFNNPTFKRTIERYTPGILDNDGFTLIYDASEMIYPRNIQLPFIHKEVIMDKEDEDDLEGVYKAIAGMFKADEFAAGD